MTHKTILTICFCLAMFIGNAQKNDINEMKAIITSQQDAWNKGDMDGYMEAYWKSDSLKFVNKMEIEYGWKTAIENYKKSFPNTQAMGKLTFTTISIEKLTNETAFMIGKWYLDRTNPVGGFFTLLWKKIDNKWVIIVDHTS